MSKLTKPSRKLLERLVVGKSDDVALPVDWEHCDCDFCRLAQYLVAALDVVEAAEKERNHHARRVLFAGDKDCECPLCDALAALEESE